MIGFSRAESAAPDDGSADAHVCDDRLVAVVRLALAAAALSVLLTARFEMAQTERTLPDAVALAQRRTDQRFIPVLSFCHSHRFPSLGLCQRVVRRACVNQASDGTPPAFTPCSITERTAAFGRQARVCNHGNESITELEIP